MAYIVIASTHFHMQLRSKTNLLVILIGIVMAYIVMAGMGMAFTQFHVQLCSKTRLLRRHYLRCFLCVRFAKDQPLSCSGSSQCEFKCFYWQQSLEHSRAF